MPCAIYNTKEDKWPNTQCNINYLEKCELPQEMWTASRNVNKEIINVYVVLIYKRDEIYATCIASINVYYLMKCKTEEHAMCDISNQSSSQGDQDVMICMPKNIKAYKSGFLMIISHKVHMTKQTKWCIHMKKPNVSSIHPWKNHPQSIY